MTADEIMDALEDQREAFLEAINGLSDEQLEQPGVVGDWSVKDIMFHLTLWEAELVKLRLMCWLLIRLDLCCG